MPVFLGENLKCLHPLHLFNPQSPLFSKWTIIWIYLCELLLFLISIKRLLTINALIMCPYELDKSKYRTCKPVKPHKLNWLNFILIYGFKVLHVHSNNLHHPISFLHSLFKGPTKSLTFMSNYFSENRTYMTHLPAAFSQHYYTIKATTSGLNSTKLRKVLMHIARPG